MNKSVVAAALAVFATTEILGSHPSGATTVLQMRQLRAYIDACDGKLLLGLDVRIAACTKALSSGWLDRRNFAAVLTDRASALEAEHNLNAALEDTNQALQYQPDMAGALHVRCKVRAELGDELEPALDDCNRSLAIRPNDLLTLDSRGFVYLRLQKYPQAIADWSYVISAIPQDAAMGLRHQKMVALTWRGQAFEDSGQRDKALADYEEALHLEPHNPVALNKRCWARAVSGDNLEGALTDCNEALRLNPNDADTLDSRAFVEFRMGNTSDALKDYNAALAADAKEESSLYMRGLIKLKTGDTAGGNADITAAKTLDPHIADRYAGYGVKP